MDLSALGARLRRDGYVLVEDYLPREEGETLLAAIRAVPPRVQVDRRGVFGRLRFDTFNGAEAEAAVPALTGLYARVNDLVDTLTGARFAPLDDRRIGLSVNITPPGGQFSFHYDRNEITAVLYLSSVEGGQMERLPRYRPLLPGRRAGWRKWAQRGLDVALWPEPMRRVLGRPVSIEPRPGRLLVMEAARGLHGVRPVQGNQTRYSVQLAYDRPGVVFSEASTRDYYGRG